MSEEVFEEPEIFEEDLAPDQGAVGKRIKPISKVDVDPVFEKRTRDLQTDAAEAEPILRKGDQLPWFRPEDWSADVFNYASPAASFDTKECEQQFIAAHKDPMKPGTTGDIITATTQIDYCDVMERALRARHLYTLPRCVALMAGRKKGHGATKGVFADAVRNYVRRLAKQAKG